MCGRFVNANNINKLKKIYDIREKINSKNDIISYNIAPSQNVNVILINRKLTIENIEWGIQYINKKTNIVSRLINSRLETIKEKILFKESFLKKKMFTTCKRLL